MVSQPRLVIAATRSGDGKTTVATGLMAALGASLPRDAYDLVDTRRRYGRVQ